MDDAGVVGPVDVEAGGVGDDRVALDGRLEARVDLPARSGEADHVRIRALGRPAGHRERREEVDVDRRLRVRGVEEVEGSLPDDLEGDDRPVRCGRARRHRRQVLSGRRQLEVDRWRRQVDEQDVHPRQARVRRRRGAPGTLERRVLLRSLDVRDAGKQRSDDGLRLHSSRAPEGQTRSDDQTGSSVGHHTSLGHRMLVLNRLGDPTSTRPREDDSVAMTNVRPGGTISPSIQGLRCDGSRRIDMRPLRAGWNQRAGADAQHLRIHLRV